MCLKVAKFHKSFLIRVKIFLRGELHNVDCDAVS